MDYTYDPAAAASALRAVDGIGNPDARRAKVDEIMAAALIDIAASLQVVAADAYLSLPVAEPAAELDDEARDFLVVGDLVTLKGDSEPGEVRKVGVDQGETFADVEFANGHADRYYTRNLERIIGDGTDPEIAEAIDASLAAVRELAEKTPAPRKGKKA